MVVAVLIIGFLKIARIGQTRNYNLILISVDTLRADHMGVYGYSKNTTPFVDEWAKNATVFTNAFTAIPLTIPSFVSLMTGRHPYQVGIFSNEDGASLNPSVKTLAEILKKQQFNTAALVSNTVFSYVKPNKLERGFDEFKYFQSMDGNDQSHGEITTEAIKWLKSNKDSQFFLWVHYADPHGPYKPKPELRCKFNTDLCEKIDSKTYEEWETERLKTYEDLGISKLKSQGCPKGLKPPEDLDVFESFYDGEIASDDEEIGKILGLLKELKLDERSVVVFYADHGEGFDHGYYFTHGGVTYNSNTKIPLIITYPGNKAVGKKSERFILNTDIFPTLLNLLAVNFKDKFSDGMNFAREFESSSHDLSRKQRHEAYLMGFNVFTIHEDNYKYTYYFDRDTCLHDAKQEELFNLDSDPDEELNLIGQEPETAKRLKNKLFEKLSEFNLPRAGGFSDHDTLEKLKSLGY